MSQPEKPPFNSTSLKSLVDSPIEARQPLIESLVYEKTVLMIYADPGVGKSIVSLCMALQASAGLPVYGFFQPVRPLKIYYVLTERGIEEPLERIKLMQNIINVNYDNLFIDEETIGLNILDINDENKFLARVEKYCPNPDIIVFDPIYAMVRGGLSNPDDATLFAQFSARVQHKFHCANWFNHHTLKNTVDIIGGEQHQKSDPFFGSQLLKAHVTGMYHLTQKDNKPHFACKKDSHSFLLKNFSLQFKPETYTLEMDIQHSQITAKDKITMFLNSCKKNGSTFTFEQFHEAIKPSSHRYTQKMIGVTVKEGRIFNVNSKFDNALYQVL